MILHTDLPEDLAAVPAGHGELQRVMVGALLQDKGEYVSINSRKDGFRGRGICSLDLHWGLLAAL